MVGNPVEGERDSGLKLNAIPTIWSGRLRPESAAPASGFLLTAVSKANPRGRG